MILKLNDSRIKTIQQVKEVLKSSRSLKFKIESREEAYKWIEKTLIKFSYITLRRKKKGIVRKYLKQITGYSRAQISRLISQYIKTGHVKVKNYDRNKFEIIYTSDDVKLLAEADELHNFPSGQALKTILGRLFLRFGKEEYENISKVSVSHIYNLRDTTAYKRTTKHYKATKPNVVRIGTRKKPEPDGKPGYLRVDTMHHGDKDDEKGVYHINTVDEVVQFQIVGAVEKISYRYMLPLVDEIIGYYPFRIIEFHADNGSEYINDPMLNLLNKLLIELTKSRARQTNDNALVETKHNVIRKFMGYGYIEQKWADEINRFYFGYFNNYLNYHRPCAFPSKIKDKKEKIKKIYRLEDYQTPYEKLKSIENAEQYLKPGVTFEKLDKIAYAYDDNEYASIMKKEKKKLMEKIMLPDLTICSL